MNDEIIHKWIIKAENDYKIAFDELYSHKPAYDMICFHFQQCAEKYLKAFLIFHNQEITKTHNISFLISRCLQIDPDFEQLMGASTERLTYYAVEARYPDDFYMPTDEEARQAMETVDNIKQFVNSKIKSGKS